MNQRDDLEKRLEELAGEFDSKDSILGEVMMHVDTHPVPVRIEKGNLSIRRIVMSKFGKLAVAAVLIIGVFVFVNIMNQTSPIALADVLDKVQKNFFHNFGNNNILNANSGFSFTMTDDWLYQERSWKTDISGFLLFISPSAQWKADLFLQYSGSYTETDLPDLDTTYNKVINSSALRVKTSLSLSRPVSYAENKLFNLFTGSIHNDSIEIEAGSFQQSENPLFGSSRILFRCTLTHTSELFMEDHFSLEALLRVQGGREEFWLSDGPEYRDSAGIELGIAAHQYF